jgi:hypothetical protein
VGKRPASFGVCGLYGCFVQIEMKQ